MQATKQQALSLDTSVDYSKLSKAQLIELCKTKDNTITQRGRNVDVKNNAIYFNDSIKVVTSTVPTKFTARDGAEAKKTKCLASIDIDIIKDNINQLATHGFSELPNQLVVELVPYGHDNAPITTPIKFFGEAKLSMTHYNK